MSCGAITATVDTSCVAITGMLFVMCICMFYCMYVCAIRKQSWSVEGAPDGGVGLLPPTRASLEQALLLV